MKVKMTFAQQFQDARQRAGLTQTQAAELLGVSLPTVKSWEAGRRKPPERMVLSQDAILHHIKRSGGEK